MTRHLNVGKKMCKLDLCYKYDVTKFEISKSYRCRMILWHYHSPRSLIFQPSLWLLVLSYEWRSKWAVKLAHTTLALCHSHSHGHQKPVYLPKDSFLWKFHFKIHARGKLNGRYSCGWEREVAWLNLGWHVSTLLVRQGSQHYWSGRWGFKLIHYYRKYFYHRYFHRRFLNNRQWKCFIAGPAMVGRSGQWGRRWKWKWFSPPVCG